MKKIILMILAVLAVSAGVMAGCSKKAQQGADNGVQSGEAVQENNGAENDGEENDGAAESGNPGNTEENASEVTGMLEEIKDFMFVVTDDVGASYAFSFEEKPQGLEQVAVGDKVVVKYTGTISEVDAFTGEVLSIEKQP